MNIFENKPVLMIHEFDQWMLDLPLENYILTFDDGLYSQYLFLKELKKINTKKIFFISTNIVCGEGEKQSPEFITCSSAHKKFFESGDKSHYMNWNQIIELSKTELCEIGGHSHTHSRFADKMPILEIKKALDFEIETMLKEFEKYNIKISSYCYPYNKQIVLYEELLKKNGIVNIFGEDRIAIEKFKK